MVKDKYKGVDLIHIISETIKLLRMVKTSGGTIVNQWFTQ